MTGRLMTATIPADAQWISNHALFRSLMPAEVSRFAEHAREHTPPPMYGRWRASHPICRLQWLHDGTQPPAVDPRTELEHVYTEGRFHVSEATVTVYRVCVHGSGGGIAHEYYACEKHYQPEPHATVTHYRITPESAHDVCAECHPLEIA